MITDIKNYHLIIWRHSQCFCVGICKRCYQYRISFILLLWWQSKCIIFSSLSTFAYVFIDHFRRDQNIKPNTTCILGNWDIIRSLHIYNEISLSFFLSTTSLPAVSWAISPSVAGTMQYVVGRNWDPLDTRKRQTNAGYTWKSCEVGLKAQRLYIYIYIMEHHNTISQICRRWFWTYHQHRLGSVVWNNPTTKVKALKTHYCKVITKCILNNFFATLSQQHCNWLGLTLIVTWISHYMPGKIWDEIIYSLPHFNGTVVEVCGWISSHTL